MSTNKTDRDNWRKFLGIKEPSAALDANRVGVDIGKSYGRSGGASSGGEIDADEIPEDEEEEGAEKGDGAGDAGEKIKVGDEFDRLEDLYDCETGEEVTIDGLGEKGTEAYPSDFQDCNDPNAGDDPSYTWYYEMRTKNGFVIASKEYTKSYDAAISWITAKPREGWSIPPNSVKSNGYVNAQAVNSTGIPISDPSFREWTVTCFNKNTTPPPEGALETKWPAVDKNHLVWNKEKNCFEPLCPELNTQVLDKYKGCEDERILCDADGNKVKVKVDGDVVKVTQEKYGQTAEIKNGKVTAVKKLTESKLEAEFK